MKVGDLVRYERYKFKGRGHGGADLDRYPGYMGEKIVGIVLNLCDKGTCTVQWLNGPTRGLTDGIHVHPDFDCEVISEGR